MLLHTPLCDFGWQGPDFTLADPYGTRHRRDDLTDPGGLVIAFICNHCPYVQAIIDRLVADARALQEIGVATLAVMPNDYQSVSADSPENMRLFAQRHDIFFPYLIDETQDTARSYGAVCTPDFFGLDSGGRLQYRGRLDDAGMRDASQRRPELVEAMRLVAETGRGPEKQSPSMGCSIKWKQG